MRRRRREHSLLLKASKILVSLGASVNLTLSHRRRALRSFPLRRPGAAGSAAPGRETLTLRAPVARSVSVYHLRSNRESAPMTTASFSGAGPPSLPIRHERRPPARRQRAVESALIEEFRPKFTVCRWVAIDPCSRDLVK